MKKMNTKQGFTLVELVIVVLILGILAAVAAPKLINTSATATDNGVRVTLGTIRNAIELYSAEYNAMPGTIVTQDADGNDVTASFEESLESYIRGPFPSCPVGTAANKDQVEVVTGDADLIASGTPTKGWKFNTDTGEFIVNHGEFSKVDPTIRYDEF